MSINVNDKNLGHATAYAYYKAGGGTMTEAEFTEFMADFGTASQTAVEAAQAALASETAARNASTTATNKATEATTAATTATTKAGEASTSASTATSAKDTAVSAASTATTKATEATTAAATATSAKTDAVAANTAAQSAKTAAQTAQTGAETAAASVQSSAAQIATNAEDISQLKSDLSDVLDIDTVTSSFGATKPMSDYQTALNMTNSRFSTNLSAHDGKLESVTVKARTATDTAVIYLGTFANGVYTFVDKFNISLEAGEKTYTNGTDFVYDNNVPVGVAVGIYAPDTNLYYVNNDETSFSIAQAYLDTTKSGTGTNNYGISIKATIKKISSVIDTLTADINDLDTRVTALESETAELPYTSITGGLNSGGRLVINENNAQKKNYELVFEGNISSFDKLVVGVWHAYSGNLWNRVIIDSTTVTVADNDHTTLETYQHTLTIENNIQVHIHTNYDLTADLTIVSNGVMFKQTIAWGDYTQIIQPYSASDGSTLTNCKYTVIYGDSQRPIWAFGDSYFNYSISRWMYYADQAGYTDSMLLDAHPGESSTSGLYCLQTALKHGKPKYMLWCMGMNDVSDANNTPDATWLTKTQTAIELCEENGIIPILGMIPTTPVKNNNGKNNWIRNSGYRYIDFPFAVGADGTGVWYNGMMSNDNLHPTEAGAKALYMRAITDFPELLVKY